MNKFELKDGLDGFLYETYNFLATLVFQLDLGAKKLVRNNVVFKNTHVGERCFVIATGPSLANLSEQHIQKLESEIVFGVNSLYKSELARRVVPTYYTLMDNIYWGTSSSAFNEIRKKYVERPPIFITDYRAKKVVDELGFNLRVMYMHSKKYPYKNMSFEIDKNIFGAMNVVTYSILVAMYMGFKDIYLLGCDYNAFCNFGRGHCYDDGDEMKGVSYNLAFYLKYYHITTEFHYLVAKMAKEKGFNVVNITDQSLLDAYPRKNVAEVL